ncbi:MAG: hypothetical protein ACKOJF_01275 [Planctomycetaceae bacterium]
MSDSRGSPERGRRRSGPSREAYDRRVIFAWGGVAAAIASAAFVRVWPHPAWAAASLLLAAALTGLSQLLQWRSPGNSQLPRWSLATLVLALMLTSLGQPTPQPSGPASPGAGQPVEPAGTANSAVPMSADPASQLATPRAPEIAGPDETMAGPRRSLLDSGAAATPLKRWISAAEVRERTLSESLRSSLQATDAEAWLEPGKDPAEPERAILAGIRFGEFRDCDQSARKQSLLSLLSHPDADQIEQLELPLLDDEVARQLQPLNKLQRLTVNGDYQLTAEGWQALLQGGARARRLSMLQLRGRNTSQTAWEGEALAGLGNLTALRELELVQAPIDLAALATVAKRCDQLRDIALRDCDFSASSEPFPLFEQAVSLDLSGSRIRSSQLEPLTRASRLQVLILERMQVGDDWQCGGFSRFDSLRRLSLRGTPCSLEDALQLTSLRRLRVLDLNDSGLSPRDLETVQRSAASELRLAAP